MTEDEIIKETRKLIGQWDNIRISGQGWSGDARRGFQFNPIRTSTSVTPPPPATTGACCPVVGSCFITSQAICEAGGGTYQGDGTLCAPDPCVTPDCTSCDDLQPTNPSGVPVHLNIVRTISGTCGDIAYAGSITYDQDLGFGLEGPVAGHFYCAHDIFNNGFGEFWTGHFTATCTLSGDSVEFGGGGAGGLLGRDIADCTWWLDLSGLSSIGPVNVCDGCVVTAPDIIETIAGPGDPSGVYIYTYTNSGITIDTTVTIT